HDDCGRHHDDCGCDHHDCGCDHYDRGRHHLDHRSVISRTISRRLTIAGLAALAIVPACSSSGKGASRNADGKVTRGGQVSVFELKPADCLNPPTDLSGEIDKIQVVPCKDAHTQEVFATVKSTAGSYPGAEALATEANSSCIGAMQDPKLGLSPDDGYFVSYLLPTFDGWNKDTDRSIVCVFVFPTLGAVSGSVVEQALAGKIKPGTPPPVSAVGLLPTTIVGSTTTPASSASTTVPGASTATVTNSSTG
ncbi:MAG: hypothetical protein ABIQ39_12090, partial [Ilumatobacteraceae bacterium]